MSERVSADRPLCIYHGNCADGFTAAWAVWRAHGDAFEYQAGFYGSAPPDVTGRDVVLVDFSYKRPVLEAMAKAARSVLILDHHKTAAADLEGLWQIPIGSSPREEWERRRIGDASAGPITGVFDMERSGAGIAWDFFHPDTERPALVDYVEDRDLWRFTMAGCREVAAFIFSFEYTFENWWRLEALLGQHPGQAINSGAAIERKHHKDIAELANKGTRRAVIAGHDVPVLNVPYTLSSDAGHLLSKGEPFAACYWDSATHRVFSLRSAEDGLDVSAIAAQFGGGGHEHAAGFQIELAHVGRHLNCGV
ncbi:phosphohydrolase [Maricaulis sp.]|uniref:phosphohydrolase n=1 Tax=Maricaulis sp. TaxID=1486257 RepID=UPI003A928443